MEVEPYLHGENSITYALFTKLKTTQLARMLSKHVNWTPSNVNVKINSTDICQVHLFPNFGKKCGYGEPDVIIITNTLVIYIEVELKLKIENFKKQIERFVELAQDLEESDRKKLNKSFESKVGRSFRGPQRLRRLFKDIKSPPYKKSALLVISEGKDIDINKLRDRLKIPENILFGWISYNKIKKMKGINFIVKVINYNLEK